MITLTVDETLIRTGKSFSQGHLKLSKWQRQFLNSWTGIRTLTFKCYTMLPPYIHIRYIKMFVFMTAYTVRKIHGKV